MMHAAFVAFDLATLQQQVDEFVDQMLAQGVRAWNCDYWPSTFTEPGMPSRREWHCQVSENTQWARGSVS